MRSFHVCHAHGHWRLLHTFEYNNIVCYSCDGHVGLEWQLRNWPGMVFSGPLSYGHRVQTMQTHPPRRQIVCFRCNGFEKRRLISCDGLEIVDLYFQKKKKTMTFSYFFETTIYECTRVKMKKIERVKIRRNIISHARANRCSKEFFF